MCSWDNPKFGESILSKSALIKCPISHFNGCLIILLLGFPFDFSTSVRSHTSQGLLQHYGTSVMVDLHEILINFIYSVCYLGVTTWLLSFIGYHFIINLLISSWDYCVSDSILNGQTAYDILNDLRLSVTIHESRLSIVIYTYS